MVINRANILYKAGKIFSFKKTYSEKREEEIYPRDQSLVEADSKTKWRVGKW